MSKTLVFTGGHHTSALEVAKKLQTKGYDIVWFGHRHSMWGDTADSAEYKEVRAAGIRFYDLHAGKFYRTYNPFKLVRIPWGFIQAFLLLNSVKPAGIVSFGGYLAVPVVLVGWIMGIPAVTHEQTLVAGWANRLIAKFVRRVAISWPSSQKHYPVGKTVLVGLPMREAILNIKSQPTNLKPVVYVTGGKQGSHGLNLAIFKCLDELLTRYQVIHQTGSSTLYKDYQTGLARQNKNYQVFDYSSDRAISALEKSDVVVSRAGAHSVYEFGLLGKRCVLVPIPWVSHNEQEINARFLVAAGNAVLLPESNLTPAALLDSLDRALKLTPRVINLPHNGASQMADLIEDLLA